MDRIVCGMLSICFGYLAVTGIDKKVVKIVEEKPVKKKSKVVVPESKPEKEPSPEDPQE